MQGPSASVAPSCELFQGTATCTPGGKGELAARHLVCYAVCKEMSHAIEQLERELGNARESYYELRGKQFDYEESCRRHDAVLEAEVNLAKARSQPYAIRINLGIETGREAPIVLCADLVTVLICEVFRRRDDGIKEVAGYAVVEFTLCHWSTFGYPNDEAIDGHPMYGKGFDAYGAFEVFNSPWTARMTEQNRVAFPDTKKCPCRHLILSFHESTFECLVERANVAAIKGGYFEAFQAASEIVNRRQVKA